MRGRQWLGVMLGAIVVTGCGRSTVSQTELTPVAHKSTLSDEELARQTVRQMLELATKGDWGAFIDHHYGEQDRFRSRADRNRLVQRFEKEWGDVYLAQLRQAAGLPIQVTDDLALFIDHTECVLSLHRDSHGEWKFHL